MFRNVRTFYGIAGGVALLCFVTYVPPLNKVFNTSYKTLPHYWLIAMAFGVLILAYAAGRMLVLRRARPLRWHPTIQGLHMHPTVWSTRHTTKSIDVTG
ncbi:hypothetical protein IWQ57_005416 [Coemansia nantahalensis]|uniref:Uncharacterized protein n=1 Tax=Coemansia nantahalensis TaxID=2789366 RepID=A0ACC1JN55_9FUNG|nr:hypothetical protein IWQ57_005416 [Coemansia nantahalensis]